MNQAIIESNKFEKDLFKLNNSNIIFTSNIEELDKTSTSLQLINNINISIQNIEVIVDFKKIDFSKLPILDNIISFDKKKGILERNTIYDYSSYSSNESCFFNTITINTKTLLALFNEDLLINEYDISLNFNAELTVNTSNKILSDSNYKIKTSLKSKTSDLYFNENKIYSKIDTKNKVEILKEEDKLIKFAITSKDRVTFEKKLLLSFNNKYKEKESQEIFSSLKQTFYNKQKESIDKIGKLKDFLSFNF